MADLTLRVSAPEEVESRRFADAVIGEHLAPQRAREAACEANGGHQWRLELDDSEIYIDCARCDTVLDHGDYGVQMAPIPVAVTFYAEMASPADDDDPVSAWIEVAPRG